MADDRSVPRRRMLRYAGAAGAAGLAGCTGGLPDLGQGTPTEATGDAVTGWAWDVAADALASTVDRYERQAPAGADVAIRKVDHAAMTDRFRPALASGSGAPAFAVLESVVAPSFIDTGGLADLSERLGQDLRGEFVDGKWEAITGRDGSVYAVPWDLGPVGVFYRRDVYAANGIDPADIGTWSEFVAAGEKLPDGIHMTNLPPNDYDGVWRRRFRQLGGQPFTDGGKVNVHGERSLRVARSLKRIDDAGIANDLQSWGSDWFDAFRDGTIASLPAGPWLERTLRERLADTAGKWGVYELPAFEAGGNRATNWGGSNLCLPAATPADVAARAWEYVRWVTTTPAVQNRLYRTFGLFPALSTAYDGAVYDERLDFFGGQRARRVFADLAPSVPGYRYTVDTPAVSAAMNTHLGRMFEGELSPEAAVREAARQVAEETGRALA